MTSEEKIYKTVSNAGICSLSIGIVIIITGIVSGTLLIINGAKLLLRKSDMIF